MGQNLQTFSVTFSHKVQVNKAYTVCPFILAEIVRTVANPVMTTQFINTRLYIPIFM